MVERRNGLSELLIVLPGSMVYGIWRTRRRGESTSDRNPYVDAVTGEMMRLAAYTATAFGVYRLWENPFFL